MAWVGSTLITGATGFVGQAALAGLLRREQRCVALVRDRLADADRVERSLVELSTPTHARGRVAFVEGRLPDGLPGLSGERIERIVHVAGSTRFHAVDGEPYRTNVEGTRALLAWADANGVNDITLVSTAYVCGRRRDVVNEEVQLSRPAFHNDYEASKWESERIATEWAKRGGRRLVIARPSIVAGDWSTGRATEFRGFYLLARALELLSNSLERASPSERHSVRLRLPGDAERPNQIVPVDYVGEAIAELALRGEIEGVFQLTHPAPPTNDQIKSWLERVFDLGGGEFTGDREIREEERSPQEWLFYSGMDSLVTYFADAPRFITDRARSVLTPAGIQCPRIDEAYIERCVRYARACRWGKTPRVTMPRVSSEACDYGAAYFERFLPDHLPQSLVARVQPLCATVRFVLDVGRAEWACRFDGGRLTQVSRGPNGLSETFGYRTTMEGFWNAISGRVSGERLFAEGQADIFGDVESALKMAALLGEFTREFPCDRARLDAYRGRP